MSLPAGRRDVVAAVVAGSPHVLTPVAGVPMVVRAVRALLATALVERVTVIADGVPRAQLADVCAGERVSIGTHVLQRAPATASDGSATNGVEEIVLLHDAARPLAPAVLAAAVVEAVRGGHGMALPVLALPDTVKTVDGRGIVTGTPDRGGLRVLQTPVALRAGLLTGGSGDPLTVVRAHTAAGGTVHTVPGHPAAFAVHSQWDLELAELVAAGKILL